MANTADLQSLLKLYSNKARSAVINYADFCDYVKKYAEHHVEESEELSRYMINVEETVKAELFHLEEQHLACMNEVAGKKFIVFLPFYTDKAVERYNKLLKDPSLPFPSMTDIPKQVPQQSLSRRSAADLFASLMEKQDLSSQTLFCVIFPGDAPPIILPESVEVESVCRIALSKLGAKLMSEDTHDYFYKKLMIANSDRETSIKLFFAMMVDKPHTLLNSEEVQGDMFYYWTQLCFFIKKDYEKLKDLTQEDINLLQAVNVAEQYLLVLKEKTQQSTSKKDSFKILETNLGEPPYFYSLPAIGKFTDSAGRLLLKNYNEDELKTYLKAMTTETAGSEMPHLLSFVVSSGTRYYVYKEKVFPLIERLCAETHDTVVRKLTDRWYMALRAFTNLPEMHDRMRFEERLHREVETVSPVLAALLALDYLPLLDIDLQNSGAGASHLFSAGQLIPMDKLLMLNSAQMLAEAKNRLPFWYSIPILNKIIALFVSPPPVKKPSVTKSQKQPVAKTDLQKRRLANRASLSGAAQMLAEDLVPQGSTIDRELDSYCNQWNNLITAQAHDQLIEDVNALIYSYTKRTIKTITPALMTDNTITSMAETMLRVPSMQKITNKNALKMYMKLYILRLVTNG